MKPLAVDSSNFNDVVLKSDAPVLVDFWAEWCPPCRVLGPMLDRAADELGDDVKIVKVDADASADLLQRFGVASIPTLILFHDGKEIERRVGPEGLAPLRERSLSLVASQEASKGSPRDTRASFTAATALPDS